jgi:phosphonate transport system substrate-binding protein
LYVGQVQIWDARRAVRSTAPDVVNVVRILAISAPIPNDTLSFGPDFPADVRQQVVDALFALAQDKEKWDTTALSTSYSWTGIAPISDSAFDPVRLEFEMLGLTEEDIFGG